MTLSRRDFLIKAGLLSTTTYFDMGRGLWRLPSITDYMDPYSEIHIEHNFSKEDYAVTWDFNGRPLKEVEELVLDYLKTF